MNPAEIATHNMVANRHGVSDQAIINAMIANVPAQEQAEFEELVNSMLSGPAGELTASCNCEGLEGYVQALTEVRDGLRVSGYVGREAEVVGHVIDSIKKMIDDRIADVTGHKEEPELPLNIFQALFGSMLKQ
jgi:hypothetical protein